jgi:hypothetical protein
MSRRVCNIIISICVAVAFAGIYYATLAAIEEHQLAVAQAACPQPIATRTLLGITVPDGCQQNTHQQPAQNTWTPDSGPMPV